MLLIEVPNTLGCHETRPLPEINDRALISCRIEAQERVLADVDSFQNWLGAQCCSAQPDRFGYMPRSDVGRAQFVASLTVAQLTALLLYPERDLAGRAAMELRERYVKAQDDYIERVTEKLMAEGWAE